jgi:hypothetical protein
MNTAVERRPASLQLRQLFEQSFIGRREKNEPETFLLDLLHAPTALSMRNVNRLLHGDASLPPQAFALGVGAVAERISGECHLQ